MTAAVPRLALRLCLLVVLTSVAAAAAFLGLSRTETGMALIRDQTERLASAALGPQFSVAFGDQTLSFAELPRLGVAFTNAAVRARENGDLLAAVSQLRAGIDLGALLAGRIEIDRVSIDGVRLDGRLSAHLPRREAPLSQTVFASLDEAFSIIDDIGLSSIDVTDMSIRGDRSDTRLGRLSLERTRSGHFSIEANGEASGVGLEVAGGADYDAKAGRLTGLSLRSGRVATTLPPEVVAGIDDANASEAGAIAATGSSSLSVIGAEGARELQGAVEADWAGPNDAMAGRGAVRAFLREGDDALRIADADFSTGGVTASFDGTVSLVPDASGTYAVALRSSTLTSSIGRADGTAASAAMTVTGYFAPASGRAALEGVDVAIGQGAINGSARLGGFKADNRLRAAFTASDLAMADVVAFWPFFVAPGARAWALDHLDGSGTIESAALSADITLARAAAIVAPDVGPRQDEVTFTSDFNDLAFSTFGDLPAIEAASGHLEYRAGKTTVAMTTGRLRDIPEVALRPSSLEFDRAEDGIAASLSVDLEGDATRLAAIADRKPLSALGKLGWKSDEIAGRARVGVGAALLVGKDGRPGVSVEGWSVVVDAEGVDLKRPVAGRDLTAIKGSVTIAPGAAIGNVEARIDGIPATIDFAQPIEPDPVGQASLKAMTQLSPAEVRTLLPQLDGIVVGPVSAVLSRKDDTTAAVVDLTAAEVGLDAIGWRKGAGIPARLSFDVGVKADDGDHLTVLENARLEGEGFSARGSIELDGSGLRRIGLNEARLNRGDDFAATVERTESGYAVSVTGRSVDARPILSRLRSDLSRAVGPGERAAPTIAATIAVDRLAAFGEESLFDARIDYRAGSRSPLEVRLSARTDEGRAVDLDIGSTSGLQRIDLSTDDMGSLLRFAGLYPHLRGGAGRLILSGADGDTLAGSMTLRTFTLVDEPRIESLVGSGRPDAPSLAGATGRRFETQTVPFDIASATLAWSQGRLVLLDGILRGPIFGASFAGVPYAGDGTVDIRGAFMPAYSVNGLFGALPFVGGILGNGQEGGLIGITYRLSGLASDPTLTINPVSAIAPGVFRRIFEY